MRTSWEKVGFLVKCLLLLPLMGLAVGCGKEGTVSGKVYYKGKALQSGAVSFFPDGKGATVSSQIGTDGSYKMEKLPPGKYKVSVATGSSKAPSAQEMAKSMGGMGAQMAQKGMEKQKSMLKEKGKPADVGGPTEVVNMPEQFSDPEKSGITVDVTGGKQVHDIKID